jgi:hypothetical protein
MSYSIASFLLIYRMLRRKKVKSGVRFRNRLGNNIPVMDYKRHICSCLVTVFAISGTSVALAQSPDWRTALQPELELSSHLNEKLNIRFGVNHERGVPLSRERPVFELMDESMQFSALVDWSLHDSGLRMTGGALYDDEISSDSDLPVPTLSSEHMSTYVGLGWDNDFGTRGRFGLSLDMGLTLDETVTTTPVESTATDTAAEDASLSSTFESFRYEPSFSAGLEYRF